VGGKGGGGPLRRDLNGLCQRVLGLSGPHKGGRLKINPGQATGRARGKKEVVYCRRVLSEKKTGKKKEWTKEEIIRPKEGEEWGVPPIRQKG